MGVFCVFYACMKLHSKQIETLELAPKFVKQLFVNNKAYDPAFTMPNAYACLRFRSLLSINSSLKIDWKS